MADPNLTESAWRRATIDAARLYRTTPFQLGGALLTAIFSSLSLIAQEGQPTTTQVAVALLSATAAILLSVAFVFAWQLVAAPVRQLNELKQKCQAPKDKLNVRLALRNMQRKGEELTHRVAAVGRMNAEIEMEEWTDGVVDFLAANIPEDSAEVFIVAGASEAEARHRLQARLQALQQIIDRYEVDLATHAASFANAS